MENLSTLQNYYEKFGCFLKTVILLERYFNKLMNLTTIDDQGILKEFFSYDLNDQFEDTGEVCDAIDDFKVVKKFGKYDYIDKIIGFIYLNIMKFIGYVHSYCNLKVRKYRDKISVIANNLFHFDFFFLCERYEGWHLED